MDFQDFQIFKKTVTEQNFLDRVIMALDPQWGATRLQSRFALAKMEAYTGASRQRTATKTYLPVIGSANADTIDSLETLRARSRDLVRNNPIACGAIENDVANVVGTGLRLQSQVDGGALELSDQQAAVIKSEIEREWAVWSESFECDWERQSQFVDLQELVLRQVLENGDVFALLPYRQRPGEAYGLKLQLVEADRVDNPSSVRDTEQIAGGVERDAVGEVVAYHINRHHPGSIDYKTNDYSRYRAFGGNGQPKVLHLFFKKRPSQNRGVPVLAPVIESLKQLGDFTEGELQSAVISSLFTVAITTADGMGLDGVDVDDPHGSEYPNNPNNNKVKLGTGNVLGLAPGEDVRIINSSRPSAQFEPFFRAICVQIGMALNVPVEVLLKQFNSSYSASRAALLEAWRHYLKSRDWLVRHFCQPVFELWLTEAVASGRVNAPGYLGGDPAIRKAYAAAKWVGPAQGQIDELKETNAAILRVDNGFSTLENEVAGKQGGDWEDVLRQRAREKAVIAELDLVLGSIAPIVTTAAGPANGNGDETNA